MYTDTLLLYAASGHSHWNRWDLLLQDLDDETGEVWCVERNPETTHLIEHTPRGPDITLVAVPETQQQSL